MRILAISHSCAVEVNQQLYLELNRSEGNEVLLIAPERWRHDYSKKVVPARVLEGLRPSVRLLKVRGAGSLHMHIYKGLGSAFERFRPDIVFVDEEPWSFVAAQAGLLCKRWNVPFVLYTKQNLFKRYPLPFRAIERWTHQNASAMAIVSTEVGAVLRAKGYAGPAVLLPHACDLGIFYPGGNPELRARLGLSGVVVGYMGRLVPEKGADIILNAMAKLLSEEPGRNVNLLLVGTGGEEEKLRRQAEKLRVSDRVVFAGAVPHAKAGEIMRCMDVFVLPSRTTPSWKEQFGRVVIEAMACGVPVVGSTSGYIPELIADTGGGITFREDDVDDLAEKLSGLIRDSQKRQVLADSGRNSVGARFTYKAVALALKDLLAEVRSNLKCRS